EPGTTLTYEFPIKQSGTYWYHSHTGLQEQVGVYGSIVIEPLKKRTDIPEPAADYVLLVSDWTDESPREVMRDLKRGGDYQSIKKGTKQTLYGVIKNGVVLENIKRSFKRMPTADISDVAYDRFLINGEPESSFDLPAGKVVRLRIINGSSSTYFYVNYAGGAMKVIAADGQDVVPVDMDRMLIAVAETYDVLVTVPEGGAYEFRATAQDGTGHSSLYLGEGGRVYAPDIPEPEIYGMGGGMKPKGAGDTGMADDPRPMPPYDMLRSVQPTTLPKGNETKEFTLVLGGDMDRYVWTINGKTLSADDTIRIRKGENVRFILENKTMMHHPMHLHGHFFRVLNGQGEYAPLKHTVDVVPDGKTVIEFAADQEKDWFFHCHILYHLAAGMARVVHYEGSEMDPDIAAIRHKLYEDPIYYWAEAALMSNMTEGFVTIENEKNTLNATWEFGWENREYEIVLTYNRSINRLLSVFGGADLTNENQNNRGVFGIAYLLPFLIDGTAWVDTDGDFRFILDKEMQITERVTAFGELQYDTESKWEWKAGGTFMIGKNVSLIGQYYTEFGGGGGLLIKF
ncbi:MAG TPA: multicopper oxidase domain-containing protein, partial [Thermodesulfobacteriota bacterium]|nr:multicopper oxidase domain-containing protein [Thermodesulfobacteriota bacterium]